jgi:hypothetical protein
MNIIIKKTGLPDQTLIAVALTRVDYADNYTAGFDSARVLAPIDAARAFFRSFPPWVMFLLRIRNVIASLFRLKTGDGAAVEDDLARFTGERGQSVAGFEVFGSSPAELLMGADDRHLDFRLSFFLERSGDRYTISAATTVRFNGRSGRVYFFFVGPFHRIIMPAIIRRMINMHLAGPGT